MITDLQIWNSMIQYDSVWYSHEEDQDNIYQIEMETAFLPGFKANYEHQHIWYT